MHTASGSSEVERRAPKLREKGRWIESGNVEGTPAACSCGDTSTASTHLVRRIDVCVFGFEKHLEESGTGIA